MVVDASLLYSRDVSCSRAPRALLAALLVVLLTGCATTGGLVLPPRPAAPDDAARAAALGQFIDASERLRAHAAFYDHEVRKNHTKMRLMGVLAILGAGGAAGVTASAFQPELPDLARPGLTSLSISLSVLSGVFVLLPHAHQYIIKEAGYRRQAAAAHSALGELVTRCGTGRLLSPETPIEAVDACVARAEAAIGAVRTLPDESPCTPPPDRDLQRILDRARTAQ